MAKDNALQRIDSHEKLCRIMQKQTHDYLAKNSLPINRSKFQYIDNLSELESSLSQSNNSKNKYFIAYWSFSETPLELRKKFVQFSRIARLL